MYKACTYELKVFVYCSWYHVGWQKCIDISEDSAGSIIINLPFDNGGDRVHEMSADFYETIRHHIPENSSLVFSVLFKVNCHVWRFLLGFVRSLYMPTQHGR